eukprot:3089143-Rhodomonas_salina.2
MSTVQVPPYEMWVPGMAALSSYLTPIPSTPGSSTLRRQYRTRSSTRYRPTRIIILLLLLIPTRTTGEADSTPLVLRPSSPVLRAGSPAGLALSRTPESGSTYASFVPDRA